MIIFEVVSDRNNPSRIHARFSRNHDDDDLRFFG